jgi:lipoyl(octanoyl) transferase
LLLEHYRHYLAAARAGVGTNAVTVRRLGLQNYQHIYDAMAYITRYPSATRGDEIWILSHKPVFTLGQAGKLEHVLDPGSIPVIKVDRGGQVTYHGPGQLVVYLLLNLKARQLGARQLVEMIEQSLIATLATYGITAHSCHGAPGVYVDDAKIAALGLRIRNGRSYHGLSLNVNMDLTPFQRINPCGYQGLAVTQMADLMALDKLGERPMHAISTDLVNALLTRLDCQPIND